MVSPLRLEVFENTELPEGPACLMPEEIEDLRLTAFERGYIAGYEDAGRRAETEAAAVQARIAQAIETLNFTYQEARVHCLAGLEPLLKVVIGTLLPATAQAALVPVVIEQLLPLAATQGGRPLRLHVPPGRRDDFSAAFDGLVLPPMQLIEDPQLDDGQAEILSNDDEARIDLSAVVAQVEAALSTHYHIPATEAQHG